MQRVRVTGWFRFRSAQPFGILFMSIQLAALYGEPLPARQRAEELDEDGETVDMPKADGSPSSLSGAPSIPEEEMRHRGLARQLLSMDAA